MANPRLWSFAALRVISGDMIPSAELTLARTEDTVAFGRRLGRVLRIGDVIALHGALGAGKTTLARGVVSGFLQKDVETPSPTFTLIQTYEKADGVLHHFDLYRLDRPDDVIEIGWEDALDDAIVVEWPDKAGRHLPIDRLDVTLTTVPMGRTAHLEAGPSWRKRLAEILA